MGFIDMILLASLDLVLKTDATAAVLIPIVKGLGKLLKSELANGGNYGLVKTLSEVGAGALALAYDNGRPQVAGILATVAIDLLLEAIRGDQEDMVKALSEIFVEGLVKGRENPQYKDHVDGMVEERRETFNQALRNERCKKRAGGPTADELAQMATRFLAASIGFQLLRGDRGYHDIVHYFSTSWVKALKQGTQDGCADRVTEIVADRTGTFIEAMKMPWGAEEVQEAEILSEAGVEVLLRAVEEAPEDKNDSEGQVRMFAQSWVDGLAGALSDHRARVEAVVGRRTRAFKDAFGRRAKEATTLANAAIAVLVAAVEKGNVDLNLLLSRSWVTALEGVGYDVRVTELVKQRTIEFNDAVTRRNIPRAKILSKVAIAILLAAVERSKELVPVLADSWAEGLGKIVATRIKAERDEVCKDAVNFAKALREGPRGMTLETLEGARLAILEASESHEGVNVLIHETWEPIFS